MNLLAKTWIGLLLIAGLFIFSCEDPSDIGLELTNLPVDVVYQEITLPASNVFVDSIRTSENASLMVGRVESEIFGATNSTALSALTFIGPDIETVSDSVTVGSDKFFTTFTPILDSVVMTLEVNYVHSSNVGDLQTFTVHKLDDQLFSGVYYLANFDTPILPNYQDDEFSFTVDADSLMEVWQKDQTDDDYEPYRFSFKLSDSLSTEFFDIAHSDFTYELLKNEFKGIALQGAPDGTIMTGFSPTGTSNIRIHYHIWADTVGRSSGILADSLTSDFIFATNGARYNKFQTDRSGSVIGGSISNNLKEFDTNDGNVYFMPGSGIFPKVSLQPLHDFFDQFNPEEGQFLHISRAEFTLKTGNTDTLFEANPSNFRFLFMADSAQVNTTGLAESDLYSTIVLDDIGYQANSYRPLTAYFNNDSLEYNANMSAFVQHIEDGTVDVEKLVLMPQTFNSMNYSVFNIEEIKLGVYYIISDR